MTDVAWDPLCGRHRFDTRALTPTDTHQCIRHLSDTDSHETRICFLKEEATLFLDYQFLKETSRRKMRTPAFWLLLVAGLAIASGSALVPEVFEGEHTALHLLVANATTDRGRFF